MPDTKPPFHFWRFFFSPRGRASRLVIWTFVLPVRLFPLVGTWLLQNIGFSQADMDAWFSAPWMLLYVSISAVSIVSLWPEFALLVKRLHDIGRSGIFAAPVFYPLAWGLGVGAYMGITDNVVSAPGTIVGLIMGGLIYYPLVLAAILAFVPGQRKTNRFGAPVTGAADDVSQHF